MYCKNGKGHSYLWLLSVQLLFVENQVMVATAPYCVCGLSH